MALWEKSLKRCSASYPGAISALLSFGISVWALVERFYGL
jgi:hypothetical protein